MPRLSAGVLLVLTFAAAAMLAVLTITAFLHEIPRLSSGTQEDYIIDGYYYYFLGQSAVTMTRAEQISLLDAATQLQPNPESAGVVYLNALLCRVLPSVYCVSFVLLTAYWIVLSLLLNTKRVSSAILFMPFSGLMPYLFIPSKEAFLVLGILLVVLAYLDRRFIPAGVFGVVLIYLARPDAAYFLLLSCVLAPLYRRRRLMASLLLAGVVVYFWWLRPAAFLFAELEQGQAFISNSGFCNLGPLSVCMGSSGMQEVVYIQRLLSLGGLPLKWIWEGCNVFWSGVTVPTIIIRITLVVQIIWACLVFLKRQPADQRAAMVRRAAAGFSGVYFLLYGALVYFQSTRQLVFVTTILLIGWCVHSRTAREEVGDSGESSTTAVLSS
jgi:hypothetical protein